MNPKFSHLRQKTAAEFDSLIKLKLAYKDLLNTQIDSEIDLKKENVLLRIQTELLLEITELIKQRDKRREWERVNYQPLGYKIFDCLATWVYALREDYLVRVDNWLSGMAGRYYVEYH